MRRERLSVTGTQPVGPYTLLRVERGGIDPGVPGQFFMLEAPGRLLPRPMSLCLAPFGELAFLIDPVGPGTRALCGLRPGETLRVLGPLGNGFRLDSARPLLVGGGVGVAPLPYLSEVLGGPPALLGFRSAWHAEAASLVPNAQVVLEPAYVTELIPAPQEGFGVLACGPEPMLEAVRRLAPSAQLAREAPMACGFGACYGCAVEIDGQLKRLCVEGPVLSLPAERIGRERRVA
ncbi:MAG: dihydroorotate dehydrogenase electron transfer subunit [Gaiellaceae bacterium]